MSADESELSVEKIFESFLEARARGGSPDEKDIYLKYPQHKHKLEAMFCALGRIDDCFRKIRDTSAEKTAEEVSLRNLRITGYRVLEKIGEGGMSSVFLAEQESLKRPVALKIMSASWSGDSKAIARFRREAETIAQLDHPGIVPIHEFGKDAGVYFLALEFIPGLSLADLIGYLKNRGVPERGTPVFDFMRARFEREKARITGYGLQPPCFDGSGFFWSNTYFDICAMVLRSLAAALESAHDKSIVHRDIKPSNIILTPNGRPHIIDFGLSSSQAATSLTRSTDFLGTVFYASPEQVMGSPRDFGPASDIFSLGAVMYELLTLRRPFEGETVPEVLDHLINREPTPPREINPHISLDLQIVCLRALEKEARHRYSSAKAFKEDLQRVLENRPIRARPAPLGRKAVKALQRNPSLASVSFLGLAISCFLGWRMFRAQDAAMRTAVRLADSEARIEKAMVATDERIERERYRRILSEGSNLFGRGNSEMAIWKFSEGIEIFPENPEGYLLRAKARAREDSDRFEGLKDLNRFESLAGRTLESLALRAEILEGMGKDKESIRVEREISATFPDDQEAPRRLAFKLMETGAYAEAAALLEERIVKKPNAAGLLSAAVLANLGLKKKEKALEYGRRAVEISPEDPSALSAFGHALLVSGEYKRAFLLFEKALNQTPEDVTLRVFYGEALTLYGDFEAGERQFLSCLERDSHNGKVLQSLASNLIGQGKLVAALDRYKESLAEGFDDARTNRLIAEILRRLSRGDEATYYDNQAARLESFGNPTSGSDLSP